jgi:tetratricopeptide (TPR) repeat protein
VIRLLSLLALCAAGIEGEIEPARKSLAKAVEMRDAGKKVEALREFRRAARLDPTLPNVHREIGLILLDRRDFQRAARAFRVAVQRDQKDDDSRYNLALSLANAGEFDGAIKAIQSVLERRPDWAQAWFGLGHIRAIENKKADAEAALRKAVSLDAALHRAQFELGKLLDERGDRDGAIEAFSVGVRAAPNSPATRYRLATLLRQAGRREEAAREFQAVRELREKNARGEQAALAYRQGMTLANQGDDAGAIRELRRALELRPDFPELREALAQAHEQRGIALEKRGDVAGAIEQFRLSSEVVPQPEIENHIGVLLAKSGRVEDAIPYFRRALELRPDYPSAKVNLQQALLAQQQSSKTKP